MRSVRLRLLLIALLPLIVVLPLLFGATMLRWISQYDDLLASKVVSDLRVAEQYFGRIEAAQASGVAAVAKSVGFAEAKSGGEKALIAFLDRERATLALDFLILGTLSDLDMPDAMREVAQAAKPDAPSAYLIVLSAQDLAAISEPMAARAAVSLVPTEAARSIDRAVEDRGMLILTAHRLAGSESVLLGGRLLNHDLDIIDNMNALVHRDESGAISRTGTTTLFLDDVRISTNVRLFEGSRALGPRVWGAVCAGRSGTQSAAGSDHRRVFFHPRRHRWRADHWGLRKGAGGLSRALFWWQYRSLGALRAGNHVLAVEA